MRDLKAFIAGVVSTLVFHQGMLAMLYITGLSTRAPYVTTPTWPMHLPAFISLAFWGGVWAIAIARVVRRFGYTYWTEWIVLSASLPTLVAWFVVFPLKGLPGAGGGSPAFIATSLLLNAAWGFGVALLLRVLQRVHSERPWQTRRALSDH
jgi:hypothetical protein